MTFEFREPKREGAPVLIGLAAPSGGGKTFSGCLLARGLSGGKPFAFIDTENGRGLHYADYFPDMRHTHLRAPFSSARYAEAIKAADDACFPVIVVDSASHEYEGEGGVLRMQEAEFKRLGEREAVRMLSWKEPKTQHKAYVRQLLQTKAHVILCMRAEDKVEMIDKPGGGKEVVPKKSLVGAEGFIPIMERRMPFELTMSLLLTPDRPGFPKPIKLQEQHRPFFPPDKPISAEAGERLAAWAAGGLTEPGSASPHGDNASPGSERRDERSTVASDVAPGSASSLADLKQTHGLAAVISVAREHFPNRPVAELDDDELVLLADHLAGAGVGA